jgi:cupin 2 domain-containing protein
VTLRFGRLGEGPRPPEGGEDFLELLREGGARVERILSRGHADPPGRWYDQDGTEFVLLVAGAAVLGFADGTERRMEPGDWAVLPARCRHRVAWTDPARETLWLAVHLPAAADPLIAGS